MFDATHLQNVQPTATVNVAEKSNFHSSNHQGKPDLKSFNIQTRDSIGGSFEFGFWNSEFPDRIQIPRGWTARVSCSKPPDR